jgi:hypothetical protein
MIDRLDAPAAAVDTSREPVESLMSRLPAAEAFAAVEHHFGVLPLVAAFFPAPGPVERAMAPPRLASLGLFTPAPEPGWEASAVAGEASGAGLLLRGEVRLSGPGSDGSLVLARLESGEHRLAWLDHGASGVERRGARTAAQVRAGAPCWLALDGAMVDAALLSGPVTLAALAPHLEAYAGVWALAATICMGEGIRALRRAARTTTHRGAAFRDSQRVTLGITEVEIEAELTAVAVRASLALAPGDPAAVSGLLLAAAAARALAAVVALTAELRDGMGLEIDGPCAEATPSLTAFLGGPPSLESELARALGIPAREEQR